MLEALVPSLVLLAHATLQWPCDGPLAANPPALWGNGQVFAAGADDVAGSVFVGEKVSGMLDHACCCLDGCTFEARW